MMPLDADTYRPESSLSYEAARELSGQLLREVAGSSLPLPPLGNLRALPSRPLERGYSCEDVPFVASCSSTSEAHAAAVPTADIQAPPALARRPVSEGSSPETVIGSSDAGASSSLSVIGEVVRGHMPEIRTGAMKTFLELTAPQPAAPVPVLVPLPPTRPPLPDRPGGPGGGKAARRPVPPGWTAAKTRSLDGCSAVGGPAGGSSDAVASVASFDSDGNAPGGLVQELVPLDIASLAVAGGGGGVDVAVGSVKLSDGAPSVASFSSGVRGRSDAEVNLQELLPLQLDALTRAAAAEASEAPLPAAYRQAAWETASEATGDGAGVAMSVASLSGSMRDDAAAEAASASLLQSCSLEALQRLPAAPLQPIGLSQPNGGLVVSQPPSSVWGPLGAGTTALASLAAAEAAVDAVFEQGASERSGSVTTAFEGALRRSPMSVSSPMPSGDISLQAMRRPNTVSPTVLGTLTPSIASPASPELGQLLAEGEDDDIACVLDVGFLLRGLGFERLQQRSRDGVAESLRKELQALVAGWAGAPRSDLVDVHFEADVEGTAVQALMTCLQTEVSEPEMFRIHLQSEESALFRSVAAALSSMAELSSLSNSGRTPAPARLTIKNMIGRLPSKERVEAPREWSSSCLADVLQQAVVPSPGDSRGVGEAALPPTLTGAWPKLPSKLPMEGTTRSAPTTAGGATDASGLGSTLQSSQSNLNRSLNSNLVSAGASPERGAMAFSILEEGEAPVVEVTALGPAATGYGAAPSECSVHSLNSVAVSGFDKAFGYVAAGAMKEVAKTAADDSVDAQTVSAAATDQTYAGLAGDVLIASANAAVAGGARLAAPQAGGRAGEDPLDAPGRSGVAPAESGRNVAAGPNGAELESAVYSHGVATAAAAQSEPGGSGYTVDRQDREDSFSVALHAMVEEALVAARASEPGSDNFALETVASGTRVAPQGEPSWQDSGSRAATVVAAGDSNAKASEASFGLLAQEVTLCATVDAIDSSAVPPPAAAAAPPREEGNLLLRATSGDAMSSAHFVIGSSSEGGGQSIGLLAQDVLQSVAPGASLGARPAEDAAGGGLRQTSAPSSERARQTNAAAPPPLPARSVPSAPDSVVVWDRDSQDRGSYASAGLVAEAVVQAAAQHALPAGGVFSERTGSGVLVSADRMSASAGALAEGMVQNATEEALGAARAAVLQTEPQPASLAAGSGFLAQSVDNDDPASAIDMVQGVAAGALAAHKASSNASGGSAFAVHGGAASQHGTAMSSGAYGAEVVHSVTHAVLVETRASPPPADSLPPAEVPGNGGSLSAKNSTVRAPVKRMGSIEKSSMVSIAGDDVPETHGVVAAAVGTAVSDAILLSHGACAVKGPGSTISEGLVEQQQQQQQQASCATGSGVALKARAATEKVVAAVQPGTVLLDVAASDVATFTNADVNASRVPASMLPSALPPGSVASGAAARKSQEAASASHLPAESEASAKMLADAATGSAGELEARGAVSLAARSVTLQSDADASVLRCAEDVVTAAATGALATRDIKSASTRSHATAMTDAAAARVAELQGAVLQRGAAASAPTLSLGTAGSVAMAAAPAPRPVAGSDHSLVASLVPASCATSLASPANQVVVAATMAGLRLQAAEDASDFSTALSPRAPVVSEAVGALAGQLLVADQSGVDLPEATPKTVVTDDGTPARHLAATAVGTAIGDAIEEDREAGETGAQAAVAMEKPLPPLATASKPASSRSCSAVAAVEEVPPTARVAGGIAGDIVSSLGAQAVSFVHSPACSMAVSVSSSKPASLPGAEPLSPSSSSHMPGGWVNSVASAKASSKADSAADGSLGSNGCLQNMATDLVGKLGEEVANYDRPYSPSCAPTVSSVSCVDSCADRTSLGADCARQHIADVAMQEVAKDICGNQQQERPGSASRVGRASGSEYGGASDVSFAARVAAEAVREAASRPPSRPSTDEQARTIQKTGSISSGTSANLEKCAGNIVAGLGRDILEDARQSSAAGPTDATPKGGSSADDSANVQLATFADRVIGALETEAMEIIRPTWRSQAGTISYVPSNAGSLGDQVTAQASKESIARQEAAAAAVVQQAAESGVSRCVVEESVEKVEKPMRCDASEVVSEVDMAAVAAATLRGEHILLAQQTTDLSVASDLESAAGPLAALAAEVPKALFEAAVSEPGPVTIVAAASSAGAEVGPPDDWQPQLMVEPTKEFCAVSDEDWQPSAEAKLAASMPGALASAALAADADETAITVGEVSVTSADREDRHIGDFAAAMIDPVGNAEAPALEQIPLAPEAAPVRAAPPAMEGYVPAATLVDHADASDQPLGDFLASVVGDAAVIAVETQGESLPALPEVEEEASVVQPQQEPPKPADVGYQTQPQAEEHKPELAGAELTVAPERAPSSIVEVNDQADQMSLHAGYGEGGLCKNEVSEALQQVLGEDVGGGDDDGQASLAASSVTGIGGAVAKEAIAAAEDQSAKSAVSIETCSSRVASPADGLLAAMADQLSADEPRAPGLLGAEELASPTGKASTILRSEPSEMEVSISALANATLIALAADTSVGSQQLQAGPNTSVATADDSAAIAAAQLPPVSVPTGPAEALPSPQSTAEPAEEVAGGPVEHKKSEIEHPAAAAAAVVVAAASVVAPSEVSEGQLAADVAAAAVAVSAHIDGIDAAAGPAQTSATSVVGASEASEGACAADVVAGISRDAVGQQPADGYVSVIEEDGIMTDLIASAVGTAVGDAIDVSSLVAAPPVVEAPPATTDSKLDGSEGSAGKTLAEDICATIAGDALLESSAPRLSGSTAHTVELQDSIASQEALAAADVSATGVAEEGRAKSDATQSMVAASSGYALGGRSLAVDVAGRVAEQALKEKDRSSMAGSVDLPWDLVDQDPTPEAVRQATDSRAVAHEDSSAAMASSAVSSSGQAVVVAHVCGGIAQEALAGQAGGPSSAADARTVEVDSAIDAQAMDPEPLMAATGEREGYRASTAAASSAPSGNNGLAVNICGTMAEEALATMGDSFAAGEVRTVGSACSDAAVAGLIGPVVEAVEPAAPGQPTKMACRASTAAASSAPSGHEGLAVNICGAVAEEALAATGESSAAAGTVEVACSDVAVDALLAPAVQAEADAPVAWRKPASTTVESAAPSQGNAFAAEVCSAMAKEALHGTAGSSEGYVAQTVMTAESTSAVQLQTQVAEQAEADAPVAWQKPVSTTVDSAAVSSGNAFAAEVCSAVAQEALQGTGGSSGGYEAQTVMTAETTPAVQLQEHLSEQAESEAPVAWQRPASTTVESAALSSGNAFAADVCSAMAQEALQGTGGSSGGYEAQTVMTAESTPAVQLQEEVSEQALQAAQMADSQAQTVSLSGQTGDSSTGEAVVADVCEQVAADAWEDAAKASSSATEARAVQDVAEPQTDAPRQQVQASAPERPAGKEPADAQRAPKAAAGYPPGRPTLGGVAFQKDPAVDAGAEPTDSLVAVPSTQVVGLGGTAVADAIAELPAPPAPAAATEVPTASDAAVHSFPAGVDAAAPKKEVEAPVADVARSPEEPGKTLSTSFVDKPKPAVVDCACGPDADEPQEEHKGEKTKKVAEEVAAKAEVGKKPKYQEDCVVLSFDLDYYATDHHKFMAELKQSYLHLGIPKADVDAMVIHLRAGSIVASTYGLTRILMSLRKSDLRKVVVMGARASLVLAIDHEKAAKDAETQTRVDAEAAEDAGVQTVSLQRKLEDTGTQAVVKQPAPQDAGTQTFNQRLPEACRLRSWQEIRDAAKAAPVAKTEEAAAPAPEKARQTPKASTAAYPPALVPKRKVEELPAIKLQYRGSHGGVVTSNSGRTLNLLVGAAFRLEPMVQGLTDHTVVAAYSVDPALPVGLVLDLESGVITGSPSQKTYSQVYQVSLQALHTSASSDTRHELEASVQMCIRIVDGPPPGGASATRPASQAVPYSPQQQALQQQKYAEAAAVAAATRRPLSATPEAKLAAEVALRKKQMQETMTTMYALEYPTVSNLVECKKYQLFIPRVFMQGKPVPISFSSAQPPRMRFRLEGQLSSGISFNEETGVIRGVYLHDSSVHLYKVTLQVDEGGVTGFRPRAVCHIQVEARLPPSGLRYATVESSFVLGAADFRQHAQQGEKEADLLYYAAHVKKTCEFYAKPEIDDGAATHFDITPKPPAGMHFDAKTGVLSGLPAQRAPDSYRQTFEVAAINAVGRTTCRCCFEVFGESFGVCRMHFRTIESVVQTTSPTPSALSPQGVPAVADLPLKDAAHDTSIDDISTSPSRRASRVQTEPKVQTEQMKRAVAERGLEDLDWTSAVFECAVLLERFGKVMPIRGEPMWGQPSVKVVRGMTAAGLVKVLGLREDPLHDIRLIKAVESHGKSLSVLQRRGVELGVAPSEVGAAFASDTVIYIHRYMPSPSKDKPARGGLNCSKVAQQGRPKGRTEQYSAAAEGRWCEHARGA
eukprot:TRINITY_DN9950_c0_g1_i1.p1 TRINITY_DN9950_c0_g1~~TRINITY_DN9950_c0_g1_i1.p1  ORF type:complete len:4441 (-),score=1188.03 TRINITY_DN9950_c0_g1_i1:78-13400(-)